MPDEGVPFQLVTVLSNDADGTLRLASTEAGKRYPSLTPRIPQLHLFERELHEQYGIAPEDHPWLKSVRFEKPDGPPIGVMDFYRVEGNKVHKVTVGPIHAGVIECGHFRFQCLSEIMMHLEISLGYHHRGIETLLARASRPDPAPDRGDGGRQHHRPHLGVLHAAGSAGGGPPPHPGARSSGP